MLSKPNLVKSRIFNFSSGLSTLLTTTNTFFPVFLRCFDISKSRGVKPSFPSTTKKIRFEESIAICTCSTVSLRISSFVFSSGRIPSPPVSMIVKGIPCHSTSALTLSRVTPGSLCTMAIRLPAILLNSADLPTFGLPIIEIIPDIITYQITI